MLALVIASAWATDRCPGHDDPITHSTHNLICNPPTDVLNERWYNNISISDDPGTIVRMSDSAGVELLKGSDCYFYANGTFRICLWTYLMGAGCTRQESAEGTYVYFHALKEITLIFGSQRTKNNATSAPYYFMKGLSERGQPAWKEIDKTFPTATIRITGESGDTVRAELSVNGKDRDDKISFGECTFVREKTGDQPGNTLYGK